MPVRKVKTKKDNTKRVHNSIGFFLAQYLCNGFNLTDEGRLTYDRTYFAEGGRAFEFMRKKTSGTWARHSFATNLKVLGIEVLYISESMGHSIGNNITAGYQDMYPLMIRFEYNSKLLNLAPKPEAVDVDSMSPEQMKEMLKKVLGQK